LGLVVEKNINRSHNLSGNKGLKNKKKKKIFSMTVLNGESNTVDNLGDREYGA
jgi:hypothetical protein